jgi:hypothetical protein
VAEELTHYGNTLAQGRRRHPGPAAPLSPLAEAALALLPDDARKDPAAVDQWRHRLEDMATAAPMVTLVMAVPPGPALKHELVDWLRTNVHPALLVSFHANPDIAGGLVIRSTSHVYDCSFRQGLLRQPERFTKVLEHV